MMIDKEIEVLLEEAILNDGKFIAKVYKLQNTGKTPKEISTILGHQNSLTVVTFCFALEALFSKIEASELKHNSKQQLQQTIKRLLMANSNAKLHDYLTNLIKSETETQDRGAEPSNVIEENIKYDVLGFSTSHNDEPMIKSGVYVYSYPQYLSMESISPDGRALYKIGASSDTDKRIKNQRRKTEVPEDLVIVRVFYCGNAFETERKFHKILSAANFHHKSTLGGTEWFNCNLATIDAIAEALDLHNKS